MQSISVDSPAKINLYLKVLGRRSDGYHELITIFHRISLKDKIKIRKTSKPGFSLKTNHPALKNQKENLIYKAYLALKPRLPKNAGIHVTLTKRIPVARGLGGGSSNAAHFLMAMNRLFGLKLPKQKLAQIGLKLGADVPYFTHNVNQALGQGVGEKIKPYVSGYKYWFCVAIPPYQLSTKAVFKQLKAQRLTRLSADATITSVFFALKKEFWRNVLHNDLFEASCAIRPELRKLKVLFDFAGASQHLMSGSGSSMFSIHRSKPEAERVARLIRRSSPRVQVFVCHTD